MLVMNGRADEADIDLEVTNKHAADPSPCWCAYVILEGPRVGDRLSSGRSRDGETSGAVQGDINNSPTRLCNNAVHAASHGD